MIYSTFVIDAPKFLRDLRSKDIFDYSKILSKNKVLELQLSYEPTTLLEMECNLSVTGCSHAGLYLTFGLLGCTFRINVYDARYWNYDKDKWIELDEEDPVDYNSYN